MESALDQCIDFFEDLTDQYSPSQRNELAAMIDTISDVKPEMNKDSSLNDAFFEEIFGRVSLFQTKQYNMVRIKLRNMVGPGNTLQSNDSFMYTFAHGTPAGNISRILKDKQLKRSFSPEAKPTWGFFCQAANWTGPDAELQVAQQVLNSGKGSSGVVFCGSASSPTMHTTTSSGDTSDDQRACYEHGVCHRNKGDKRWCVREDIAKLTNLFFAIRVPPPKSHEQPPNLRRKISEDR